ncbi:MAG: XRE family transcriptional regulator [Salinibacterium sp.]|nr:MAG: XRE family transcriptional regulator [Salinibacterium sp.]
MDARSVDDWEQSLGEQVRSLRIAALISQDELAARANISIGALRTLERGEGSSLKTLIRVARVLGRTDWLASFDPRGEGPSPIELLRETRRQRPRPQRVPRARL